MTYSKAKAKSGMRELAVWKARRPEPASTKERVDARCSRLKDRQRACDLIIRMD